MSLPSPGNGEFSYGEGSYIVALFPLQKTASTCSAPFIRYYNEGMITQPQLVHGSWSGVCTSSNFQVKIAVRVLVPVELNTEVSICLLIPIYYSPIINEGIMMIL